MYSDLRKIIYIYFFDFFRFFLEFFAHFLLKFSAELCKFAVFIKTDIYDFFDKKISQNLNFCRKFDENNFKFTHDRPLFWSFLQFSFSQL